MDAFFRLLVESLIRKYGQGENYIRMCQTCDYEKVVYTGGVHQAEGGSLMVYAEEEEFLCPNCGDDKENDKSGDHKKIYLICQFILI